MKVSVVGNKKIGVCFARLLKKKGFDLISYYCDDIETGVKYAVAAGCKAYVDLKRTVEESELIIVAVADSSLKRFMRKIASFKPENKVFCAISNGENSDSINIGGSNTYFSAFVPKFALENGNFADISDTVIFFEGSGKDYWDFYDVLYVRKVNFKIIDKTQKCGLVIAAAFVTDFKKMLFGIADDVLKKAKLDDDWLIDLAEYPADKLSEQSSEFNADLHRMTLDFAAVDSDTSHKLSSVIKVLEVMGVSYFN
ncbi:MAG: hypothetical protein SPF92_03980 [Clostridia bacterium]|nr:hypothetical protein [Oscillospiraceae bacterium]MDY5626749.1 hypothetical protein [Clostridia bacterium]